LLSVAFKELKECCHSGSVHCIEYPSTTVWMGLFSFSPVCLSGASGAGNGPKWKGKYLCTHQSTESVKKEGAGKLFGVIEPIRFPYNLSDLLAGSGIIGSRPCYSLVDEPTTTTTAAATVVTTATATAALNKRYLRPFFAAAAVSPGAAAGHFPITCQLFSLVSDSSRSVFKSFP